VKALDTYYIGPYATSASHTRESGTQEEYPMAIIFKQSNWSWQKQVVVAGDDVEDATIQKSEQKNVLIINFGF
jgi:hypothetical protein